MTAGDSAAPPPEQRRVTPRPGRTLGGLGAGAVVAVTSAAILVLEILAARLLAPYVGESLETYTAIIGVVLAGIALGSWAGGRWADRVDPRTVLGPVVAGGGVAGLLSVPVATYLGGALRGGGAVATLVITALAFFLPALLLAAATPLVVKLRLHDLAETGRTVGRLSALGTAGALAGTFLTGFVLVGAMPTRLIVLTVGSSMVVLGLGLAVWLSRRSDRSGLAATAGLGVLAAALLVAVGTPCEVETRYSCVRVVAEPDDPSVQVLVLDSLRHSAVDLDDPTHLEFAYTQTFAAVLDALPDGPLDVVHVGGGGLTMPRYLDATRPGSEHLVLEIDPALPDIVRTRLGWDDPESTTIRTGDARLALPELAADSADVVVGDAFGGLAVPWHLTTVEFAEEVERVLRPDGLYVLNVIDYGDLGFARAEAATLREVFPTVALVASPEQLAGDQGGNLVLVASRGDLDVAAVEDRLAAVPAERLGGRTTVATGAQLDAWVGDARPLTDDRAPVDQLLTPYAA